MSKDLAQNIEGCVVAEGECAFWWLGQHGFVVKLDTTILYLDPFLTALPDRLVPPLLSPADVTHAHLVLGSHDHADHIDRESWPILAAASPTARFIVPGLLLPSLATELGLPQERFIGLDDGRTVETNHLSITGIAAAHEFLDRDPKTGRYPYLGFVVEGRGFTLYHAGDTCRYEGLFPKLKAYSLDLMFLPINGRDAKRLAAGCIGNMTYQEAADLAGELQPGAVVPAHYDMFAMNLADPQAFQEYIHVKYPTQRTLVCRHGECVRLSGARKSRLSVSA